MITSGVYNGHSWKYSQAVIDTALMAAEHDITWYGLGDEPHWQGSGDHISINNDHPGYITAIDLMTGQGFSGPEMFDWLVPRPSDYPELKYIISDHKLRDVRSPFNWREQSGGDGPDHIHISFSNNYSLHSHMLGDYLGADVNPGADMSMVQLRGGRVAVVARGTTNKIYVRILTNDGKAKTDWMELDVMVGSPVDCTTRNGDDLWITALKPDTHSVLVISVLDAEKLSGLRVQDLGGQGVGGAPGITSSGNDLYLSVAGTYPAKGSIYLNRWISAQTKWSGWWYASGQAA